MSTGPFPHLSFMLVSPPLERKIKSSCTAGAVPSLATAPIIGLIVLFLDGDLLFGKLLQGLCALFLLASGNYRVARKLLPPRPAMLQQYGLSGQVVGPPPHPADRTGER